MLEANVDALVGTYHYTMDLHMEHVPAHSVFRIYPVDNDNNILLEYSSNFPRYRVMECNGLSPPETKKG